MKRLPLLLGIITTVLACSSASAFATVTGAAASPPVNTVLPTISGTAQQGQTLTAANGTWGGTTPISYGYQWQRCNASGSSCGPIATATGQNYVASAGDVGGTIRVAVSATNSDGTTQALSSATAAIVHPGSAPANSAQPNPSGIAQDGQTVSVDNGSWSGLQPITFSYQWQSCTATNPVCTDLTGATTQAYIVTTGQVGLHLRATVTATNSLGKNSAFSNLTTIVIAKASAPINTSLPLISGAALVGQRLETTTGDWNGVAANGYAYQWTRCNTSGGACATVSGATGESYGVGQADLGSTLRVIVTATNPTGSTIATSAADLIAVPVVLKASFNAVLRQNQELSRPIRTSSLAAGHFAAKLTGKTLSWTLSFSHLSGRATVVTLNEGARAASGVAFKTLCRECSSPRHGVLTLTASQRRALLLGKTYVNIRTLRNARGEIRGQINRVS